MGIPVPLALYAGVLGACVGSFLNVVAYRLPRRTSVVLPGSACRTCGRPLPWRFKIPIVSFLWLRGRCAFCREPIGRHYLVVEVLTALTYVALAAFLPFSLDLVLHATLLTLLIAAAEIDRTAFIIPNRLVLVGLGLGVPLLLIAQPSALGTHLLASAASLLALFAIRRISLAVYGRPGLGAGDAKLAAMIGLYIGWDVGWVLYLAFLFAGLVGLAGLLAGRFDRSHRLPMAPFIAAATFLVVLLQPSGAALLRMLP